MHLLDLYKPLFSAVFAAATAVVAAAPLDESVWFFADFDSPVTVGRAGVVEGDFAPGESKVYCLASRPPAELSLGLRGEPCVGGKVELALSLVAKDGSPQRGRQVVRLRVRRPDGSAADESGLAVLSGGTGSVVLRFAHDDERGSFFRKWKVEAEDLATGLKADLSFALK